MSGMWWLFAALLVVVPLALYAGYLLWRLRSQTIAQREFESAQAEEKEQQRARINRSIQIIAQAILDQQVGYSEASLRLRGLLDALLIDESTRAEFVIFFQVAEAVSDIPTHQAWKDLPKRDRRKMELRMAKLEAEHEAAIKLAAEQLLGRAF